MVMFRVLRPDELQAARDAGYLSAAEPLSHPLDRDTILDHVCNGSMHVLSFTADLNVALAFGGCLSTIAVVDGSLLDPAHVRRLDKGYLRDQHLSDRQACQRSRRS